MADPLDLEELERLHEAAMEDGLRVAEACYRLRRFNEAALDAWPVLYDRIRTAEAASDAERLLGPARAVLDRCAVTYGDDEASEMAQRIVDLIGHPITDEPPHALVALDEARAEVAAARAWMLTFVATVEERDAALRDAAALRQALADTLALLVEDGHSGGDVADPCVSCRVCARAAALLATGADPADGAE